jgi:flagellar hook-length control protein FliK
VAAGGQAEASRQPLPVVPPVIQPSAGSIPARTVDQVASALALQVRDGLSEATVVLRPAALGEVRVQISVGHEGLTLRIATERESVGELLRARAGELRDTLEGHQITVADLQIVSATPAAAEASIGDRPAWQERPWSRRDEPTPFEERDPGREARDDADDEQQ